MLNFAATKVAFDLIRTPITGIGLMCGTSHDALDIAIVKFLYNDDIWSFDLLGAASANLTLELKSKLAIATDMSAVDYVKLDRDFARFCAKSVKDLGRDSLETIDFIASHGVTVFHQPQNGITTQIGSGAVISVLTGLPVVSDFRIQDVTKGGQGAPLVPFADKKLFSEYDATINLGGFANITLLSDTVLKGYDIAPCNKTLNHFYTHAGFEGEFDQDGVFARSGKIDKNLLRNINELDYYNQLPPKSLGHEWFVSQFLPQIPHMVNTADLLSTLTENIALQIAKNLPSNGKALFTGGGTFNSFLLERIQHHSSCLCIVPDSNIIEYKEAIEFAFLGALRILNQTNIDRSVTGATSNSIAGALYFP